MHRHAALATSAALVAAAACARAPRAAAPVTITFTASDFAFSGPATAEAGLTTLRLVNSGQEPHQIQLVRLDSGKTLADLTAGLAKPGPAPAWVHWAGGPNATVPGDTSSATIALAPGNYALLCFIPSAGGTPHFAKGMVAALTVTGTAPAGQAMTGVTDTIRTSDYTFTLSRPLTAGTHTFVVTNGASQWHEVVLVALAPGKTADDVAAWVGAFEAGKANGPPPGKFIGGMTALEPGATGYFTATLAAGSYGLLCFMPDVKDGKPHVLHGMVQTITVS